MPRGARVPKALRPLLERIEAVNLDQASTPLGVLPELRVQLGVDALVYVRMLGKSKGWGIDGFESDGLPDPGRMRRALADYFASRPLPIPWVDFAQPESEDRNKAIVLDAKQLRATELGTEVLLPAGLEGMHVLRVLLCDESGLRGWIGGYSREPIRESQRQLLEYIVDPLLERIRIESMMCGAPRVDAPLGGMLQQVSEPALVIDARTRIHDMNSAARELLARQRVDVVSSIAAVLAGTAPTLEFTLTQISGATPTAARYLAALTPRADAARHELALAVAAYRWNLTPPQLGVLRLVASGATNGEIARRLEIAEPAAAQRVAAIMERAKVATREQLLAVLLGRHL